MFDPTGFVARIRGIAPTVRVREERCSDADHPYILRQPFSLPDSNFAVEVLISCGHVPGGLNLSSAILASDSAVLAQFETLFVREDLDDRMKQCVIDRWISELCTFLDFNAENVIARLRVRTGT